MFKIRLFGVPQIYLDDQPVNIIRRKSRVMALYMFASAKPVSREHLIELFEKEEEVGKQRAHFRDDLSKIGEPVKAAFLIDTNLVSVVHEKVWVDWQVFKGLMNEIQPQLRDLMPGQSLPVSLARQIEDALKLWDGQRLLDHPDMDLNNEMEEWATGLRAELNGFLERVLPIMAKHHLALLQYDQAAQCFKLTCGLDGHEYDDDAHLGLLDALLRAQRPSEARAHYKEVVQLYGEDDLPPALRDLQGRINYADTTEPVVNYKNWNFQPGILAPYLDQADTLRDLQTAVLRGGGVLVLGESGSGKTRLIYEFSRQQGRGMRMLAGSCQQLYASIPFAPIANLLRFSITEKDWKKLDSTWAAPLTALLPELATIRPELMVSPTDHPGSTRVAMLEALHQLFLLLARTARVIVFIDDAQWADESTLAVLAHLVKNSFFGHGKNLLILSARVEERNSLLDKFLLSSKPAPFSRLEPQVLTAESAKKIAYFILNQEVTTDFAERLCHAAGGNPLFMIQMLQHLQQVAPGADVSSMVDLPMPGSLVDVFQQRLSNCSRDAREMLTVAAILGNQFDFNVLEKASGLSLEAQASALEELDAVHLIRQVSRDQMRYQFIHDKLRETLIDRLNIARMLLHYRRAAIALEESIPAGPNDQCAVLAGYFENGRYYGKAFDYWVMAGRHAWALTSTKEAMDAFYRAEELIPRATDLSDDQIYRMYVIWNQIAFEGDNPPVLEHLNTSLQALGRERNSDLMLGAALSGLSDAEMARNHFPEALSSAEQASAYVERTDSKFEQARALVRRGVNIYMMGRLQESQPLFRQALALTENTEDDFLAQIERGNAFYQMAITETLRGYPVEGLPYAEQGLKTHLRARNIYGQIAAHSVMGLAYYLTTDYERGRDASLKGMELAERVDGWRMLGYLASYGAMNELELGLIDDAWEHAQKAIRIGQDRGHGEITGLGYRTIGELYQRLGNLSRAADYYQRGMTAAGNHFVALENQYRFGFCHLLQGQEIGRQYVLQAIQTAHSYDLGSISMMGTVIELEMYLYKNEPDAYAERAAWFREQVIERTGRDIAGHFFDRIRARHAFAQGDYALALELSLPLRDWYRNLKNPWHELELTHIVLRSAARLGKHAENLLPRIVELAIKLENSIQKAPVLEDWMTTKQKFVE